jgi:hypothetical protein
VKEKAKVMAMAMTKVTAREMVKEMVLVTQTVMASAKVLEKAQGLVPVPAPDRL